MTSLIEQVLSNNPSWLLIVRAHNPDKWTATLKDDLDEVQASGGGPNSQAAIAALEASAWASLAVAAMRESPRASVARNHDDPSAP